MAQMKEKMYRETFQDDQTAVDGDLVIASSIRFLAFVRLQWREKEKGQQPIRGWLCKLSSVAGLASTFRGMR